MEHYYQTVGEDWFTYPKLYSAVVKYFPDNSSFFEVGSWKGRSGTYMGVEIVNSGKEQSLVCVDIWVGSAEHQGMDILNEDGLYLEFQKNIEPVNDQRPGTIEFIRGKSLDVVDSIQNFSLDFVFIDASHEYEDVIADINSWYPKVKQGGVIAGHDYPDWPGVKKAVKEYFRKGDFIAKEQCWIHQVGGNKDFYNFLR
jgi:hypothetical protein